MKPMLRACFVTLSVPFFVGALAPLSLPGQAFGFGHGENPSLEHFVRSPEVVHISLIPSSLLTGRYLAKWSIGGGIEVVVSKRPVLGALQTQTHLWQPGKLLVGLEKQFVLPTRTESVALSNEIVFESQGFRILDLAPQRWEQFAKDPFLFAQPVSVGEKIAPRVSTFAAQNAQIQKEDSFRAWEPDSSRLLKSINELSGESESVVENVMTKIPERGSENGRSLAQKYMTDKYSELGLSSQVKCYTQGSYQGCNVEATLWGNDTSEVVIFSAHLDSVRNKGADDDGSGTAALLEMARLFSSQKPEKTIRFVSFDQEELGLIGSRAYAKSVSAETQEKVLAVFQFDMIGYDSNNDSAIHLMDCGRPDSLPLTRLLKETNAALNLNLRPVEGCTNRSDHANFWNAGIPATLISENFFGDSSTRPDSNRCYHQACDEVKLINFPYMTRIVKLVANAGWSFANPGRTMPP
jgi:hypothetical protein